MNGGTYRDASEAQRLRLEEVNDDIRQARTAVHRVVWARAARVAFGVSATAGALLVAVRAALPDLRFLLEPSGLTVLRCARGTGSTPGWAASSDRTIPRWFFYGLDGRIEREARAISNVETLLASCVFAFAVWAIVRAIALALSPRRTRLTGRFDEDLACLDEYPWSDDQSDALAGVAAAAPMTGLLMLLPVTLPLLLGAALFGVGRMDIDFVDTHVRSLVGVCGPAALVGVAFAGAFGHRVAIRAETLVSDAAIGWRALGFATLVNAAWAPILLAWDGLHGAGGADVAVGALFAATIGAALTYGIGLVFVPAMFWAARVRAIGERKALDAACAPA